MGAEREAPSRPRGLPPYDPTPDPHARKRAFLRFGLATLVLLSPLPFGSVEPLPVLLIELAGALLGGVGIWVLVSERRAFPLRVKVALLATAAIALLMLFQAIPLPAAVVRLLAPPVAEARKAVAAVLPELERSWYPLSLSPADTWDALARFAAYALLAVAALAAVRRSRDFLFLGAAFAASGLFQAVYGAAEFLSGRQQIFGYVKKYYLESATGTFINRNHYASMLAMCAPFALACASAWNARHPERPRAQHALATAVGALAAAAMLGGVALSGSRGGSAAALVGLGGYLLMTGRSWRRVLAVGALVALPVGYLLWQDVRSPLDRMDQFEVDLEAPGGRLSTWKAAAAMIPGSPVVGYGAGAFEEAFGGFGGGAANVRQDYLHQEPLQIALENGLAVLAFAFVLGGTIVAGRTQVAIAAAAWASASSCLLHVQVDFPTRIPALGVLTTVVAGLALESYRRVRVGTEGILL
jgi:O-antigen ligase